MRNKSEIEIQYKKDSKLLAQTVTNTDELKLKQELLDIKFNYDNELIDLESRYIADKKQLKDKYLKKREELLGLIELLTAPDSGSDSGSLNSESRPENGDQEFNITENLFILAIPLLLLFAGVYMILNSFQKPIKTEIEITIGKIKGKLRTEFSTDHFTTYKFPEKRKIENRIGDYYRVDLKFADQKEHFQFPTGKYFMDTDQEQLRESITNFRKEVYDAIDSNYEIELFIKGTADILGDQSFAGYFQDPYNELEFGKSTYLPYNESKGVYEGSLIETTIEEPFYNRDLPQLRAKFLHKLIIEGNSDWITPKILEGDIKLYESERERNAYLILFVNWDNRKDVVEKDNTLKYLGILSLLVGLVLLVILFLRRNKNKKR